MATAWERDMVPACWLPVEVSVVGEVDLDAAVLVVAPEFEQAVNVPLVVGRGSSPQFSLPSVEEQPSNGGWVSVGEGSSGLEGEPGLIVKAVGGGVVEGSGMVQDEWDPEVAGVTLVWVELLGLCRDSWRTMLSSLRTSPISAVAGTIMSISNW